MTKSRKITAFLLFLVLTVASGFAARGHHWAALDVEGCTVHWHETSAQPELPCCLQAAAGDYLLPPGMDSGHARPAAAAVLPAALPLESWLGAGSPGEAEVPRWTGGLGMLLRQREHRTIVLRL